MAAPALTAVDWTLRGLGLLAVAGSAKVGYTLWKAKKNSCDAACAAATMPPDAYKGQVVWITGASSGIGKGLAEALSKQGAKIILSARREKELEEVAKELKPALDASGGEVAILPIDLANLDEIPGKAAQAHKLFNQPVDVLVNNGGYSSRALARDVPGISEDKKMFDVNFFAWIALGKAVLPEKGSTRPVKIINISSIAGKLGNALRSMYCAAKAAVIFWFDALRVEEAGFWNHQVSICNVCPGSVQTDVAVNAVTQDGSKLGHTDPNIANGLKVDFVCDRILASAYCNLDEVWIAKWNELQAAYTAQYQPEKMKEKLRQFAIPIVWYTMGEEFVKQRKSKL